MLKIYYLDLNLRSKSQSICPTLSQKARLRVIPITRFKLTTKLVEKSKLLINNFLISLEKKVLTIILNLMLLFFIN
jgi:hypothetical protein